MRACLTLAVVLFSALLSACNSAGESRNEAPANDLYAPTPGMTGYDPSTAAGGRGGAGEIQFGNMNTAASMRPMAIPVAATLPPGEATVITADTAPAAVRSIIYNAGLRLTVADTLATQRVI